MSWEQRVGGMLIVRAHLSEQAQSDGRRIPLGGDGLCVSDGAPHVAIVRTQLLGRLLPPAVYLYHGQGASLVLVGQFARLVYLGQNAPRIRI